MKRNKGILIFLAIWLCVALCIILADKTIFCYVDQFECTPYRLTVPISSSAQSISTGMTYEEVVSSLGLPNSHDPLTSSIVKCWDLQWGQTLRVVIYNGRVSQVVITPPFSGSTRWIIFPGLMAGVTLLEILVYLRIRTKKQRHN